VAGWPQAAVGDVTIDLLTRQQVMDRLAEALDGTAPPTVLASANLDHVHHFAARHTLPSGLIDGIEWLTLLDGRPLVKTIRRHQAGRPSSALAGSDLLGPTLQMAAAAGARVALCGGGEATRTFWAHNLERAYPGLVVAGVWPVSWADLDAPGGAAALAGEVALSRPDLLVISLGKPRQETWLRDHMAATGAKVALPFGSAVDYIAGTRSRPPALARRLGVEWLVRLAHEPRRLSRRYLLQGLPALRVVRRELRPLHAPARTDD
jgi:N-acetylglucosaminyldiphosphoundecaprenol N-acetyl-beta-D-mannosaminyltransferase